MAGITGAIRTHTGNGLISGVLHQAAPLALYLLQAETVIVSSTTCRQEGADVWSAHGISSFSHEDGPRYIYRLWRGSPHISLCWQSSALGLLHREAPTGCWP
jgi:hypothetical protein